MNCVFIIFSTKGRISEVDHGLKKPEVKSRVLDQLKPPQKFAKFVLRPIWLCFITVCLFISGAAHGSKLQDFTEHQIIDHLDNMIDIKEPSEDISEHHILKNYINDIDPLASLFENGETLKETIYPDFDKKALNSLLNRLKRSIGTVDTIETNEIAIRGNRYQNVVFSSHNRIFRKIYFHFSKSNKKWKKCQLQLRVKNQKRY